jgi:hypothetical protein
MFSQPQVAAYFVHLCSPSLAKLGYMVPIPAVKAVLGSTICPFLRQQLPYQLRRLRGYIVVAGEKICAVEFQRKYAPKRLLCWPRELIRVTLEW